MGFLNTILSIILFLIALGVLVTIHELGHFIAAKSFKVYCSDFSIGFGPKIIKIKRKKGETKFSVGILPVGGYVSMYGEGVELPDGVDIPKSRSLEGISRYKRIIIMASGVIMNFILAYLIFFISASCFPQYNIPYINVINVYNNEDYEANKTFTDSDGNLFTLEEGKNYTLNVNTFNTEKGVFGGIIKEYDETTQEFKDSYFTRTGKNDETLYYVAAINTNNLSIYQLEEFSNFVTIYRAELYQNVKYETVVNGEKVEKTGDFYLPLVENNALVAYKFDSEVEEHFSLPISLRDNSMNETTDSYIHVNLNLTNKNNKNRLDSFGFGMNYTKYWNGWNSFKEAGDDFATSTTLISQALGQLFIGKGWENMGGPVAIFTQTTSILQNNPFNYYLQTWGIISVNLALFNLLPFPGLDGWQILVTLIEGATNFVKRRIYRKKYANVDKTYLTELEKNAEMLDDIKTKYSYKFNEKFNYEQLSLNYGTLDVESPDEKFSYYKKYILQEQENKKYAEENNLSEVEAFREWKIPERIKNIVSYIGLGLLFLLMIVIFVKDIINLF